MLHRALSQSGVEAAGEDRPLYRLKPFKYNSHYWILEFLAHAPRPSRILDIGTADGYLGAVLKENGHYLAGIESSDAAVRKARPNYDRFYHADVENFDFSSCGQFDFILLADVLEHLRDPAALLQRALPCLADGGEMIVSLPNVAHLYVRLHLLMGRFEYSDRGILDRTHLRFFTLASMKRMIQDASGQILETRPTAVPIQWVLPWTNHPLFAPLHELHYSAVRCCKTLLAYQFVFRVAARQTPR